MGAPLERLSRSDGVWFRCGPMMIRILTLDRVFFRAVGQSDGVGVDPGFHGWKIQGQWVGGTGGKSPVGWYSTPLDCQYDQGYANRPGVEAAWEDEVRRVLTLLPYAACVEAQVIVDRAEGLRAMVEAQGAWVEGLRQWRAAGGEGVPQCHAMGEAVAALYAMATQYEGEVWQEAREALLGTVAGDGG